MEDAYEILEVLTTRETRQRKAKERCEAPCVRGVSDAHALVSGWRVERRGVSVRRKFGVYVRDAVARTTPGSAGRETRRARSAMRSWPASFADAPGKGNIPHAS